MAAIKEMGQMFAASGMFGCTKLEQGQVLALACLIEGKSPFELMRNFHIIGGNLSMRASAILAEFIKKGGKCKWLSALSDANEAKATFSIGENELSEATYSIEDAKREGLTDGPNKLNWKVRAPDMLRARLTTKAIRMIAPGIVVGVIDETDVPLPPSEPLLDKKPEEKRDAAGAAVGYAITEAVAEKNHAVMHGEEVSLETMLAADQIDLEQARRFVVSLGMLIEGEPLSDLSKASRNRIMKRYPDFKEKLQKFEQGVPAR
jgi:hypothetical protein